jgi:CO dehydrogenase maturation factor
MKLVVAGKGGSGKTSVSGTLARVLARAGHDVLAIDGDSNPNLALTLGIPAERFNDVPTLPRDLLERLDDGTRRLRAPLEEICETHALKAPDGVRLLVMAHPHHAGTGCLCSMHATVRSVIETAAHEARDVCLLDTEASPEHFARGTARHAEQMLLVAEPYFKSLETARRMAELGRQLDLEVMLVGNKVRDDRDREALSSFSEQHAIPIAALIPFDDNLPEAERAGVAPLDHSPDAPAVLAIGELAQRLDGNGRA